MTIGESEQHRAVRLAREEAWLAETTGLDPESALARLRRAAPWWKRCWWWLMRSA